jgi:diguanylate cyclase (GGDEF)-like protein
MSTRSQQSPPPTRSVRAARLLVGLVLAGLTTAVMAIAVHPTAAAVFAAVFATTIAAQALYGAREQRRIAAVRAAVQRDALTGLPNRTVVEQILDAARAGDTMMVALADADGLNVVNAAAGHAAGDQYLRGIAARLAAACPPEAFLARLGGDEFVILAPNTHTDPESLAAAVAAKLAVPGLVAGQLIRLRASVGIAAGTGDPRAVLARADAALHTAKQAGNQVLVYQPERDGIPNPDGTRPLLRRRDHRNRDARTTDTMMWDPHPFADTGRLTCSTTDLATILRALRTAHDWWAGVLAGTGSTTSRPIPTADEARRQMATYANLAARITQLTAIADDRSQPGHRL